MNRTVLILLLIALLRSSSLGIPMDGLELTPEIQTEAVLNGPSDEPQIRLRREAAIVPKTPDRFCTGCFSVIGDPTRPQK